MTTKPCLICNDNSESCKKNCKRIFGDFITLQSEKSLNSVLEEILDIPLKEQELVSDHICIKCYRICIEYDLFNTKIANIKKGLKQEFAKSTVARKESANMVLTPKTTPKKIILPASKLQPLPPNYVLNVQNMCNKGQFIQLSQAFSSVNVSTSTPQKSLPIITSVAPTIKPVSLESLTNNCHDTSKDMPKTSDSIMTLNLADLPQDFLTSAVLTKIEQLDSSDGIDDTNDDMEIDQDCAVNIDMLSKDDVTKTTNETEQSDNPHNYIELNVVTDRGADNNELIFRELQIVNENGETQEAPASLLHLVSGQKLMYGDKEISLVVPDNQSNDDQDSNDGSQIELQVSGDEETANAILAAAQEQGGAFRLDLKVEGEMLQLECVPTDSGYENTEDEVLNFVRLEGNKIFACTLCEKNEDIKDKYQGDAENMMFHLKNVHSARVYICSTCDLVVRRRNDYNKHMDEHADKKYQSKHFECDICKKKYASKSLLREHMNSHTGVKPYSCDICKKTFTSKYTLQAHIKTHQNRPRPFICKQCGKSFFTVQNLGQHEKTHSGIKAFVCSICDKAFGTQHNLEVHAIVHSGHKPFSCTYCEKSFARRAELADHTRVHTGERPFACDVCGAAFSQRSNLHSHKRATHLNDRRHACQHCNKKFKRRRLLDYHMKSSHTGERPLKCKLCPCTFVYPEHYRKHARAHTGVKPYVCEICGKSFNSRDNRNTHRFVHSDKKPYECYVCGQGYMRKNTLYAHMNTTGHLAESIVVNQPRVQNVDDKITQINVNYNGNTQVLEGEEDEIELTEIDEKPKTIQTIDSTELLTYNLEDNLKTDGLLEASINQVVNTEGNADGDIRIVQIQLPDGNNGWVAINSWKK